jgi:Protein of unknown function with PCYCGC motif
MARTGKRNVSAATLAARRQQRRGWIVAGVSVAALVVASAAVSHNRGPLDHHPTPRARTAQPNVVPAARYADYPRVEETYKQAAAVPQMLDGVYCYCQCRENAGHYSLLECFASDHAAGCDVCLSEATIVYRMARKGASLEAIRAEIDRTFGA